MAILMNAPAAWPGTESVPEHGRHSQTGPKGPQVEWDGFPLVEVLQPPKEPGLSVEESGRRLHARPTQPVSVGLVGCPGCTAVLDAVGGVLIEVDERRRRRPTQGAENREIDRPESVIRDK